MTVVELGLDPSEEARSLHELLLADTAPAPTVADVRRLARPGRHTDAIAAGRAALRADLTDTARTELPETPAVCLREQGTFTAAAEHLAHAHRGHDLDARRAWRRAATLFGSLCNLHARGEVDALAL